MSLEILNETLTGLKIDAECIKYSTHRHFAFYDLKLGAKCRLSQFERQAREIALKLKSCNDPIFKLLREEGLVRLQVVVEDPQPLPIYDFIAKHERPDGTLQFLLGETDDGKPLWTDMSCNPHLLIAGTTGSGKSVLLHNLVANSIIHHNKCEENLFGDINLYLVDPKGVELNLYDTGKVSVVNQVVYNYAGAVEMLEHLTEIMEERYEMLRGLGLQSVENHRYMFSSILLIIDEVSDLIIQDDKDKKFERTLLRLAQKCRAAGIYIVLATQHPSVKIITGLIKANFEARLACKVSSRTDSQVVLDAPGAERLVGRGDAIIKNRAHDSVRFQVAYADASTTLKQLVK